IFFGSALNNFGVKELLHTFLSIAPTPRRRETDTRMVEPDEDQFSGFVFKIHANLDPKHRDRIAFMRVCSGRFQREKQFRHVRLGKDVRFSTLYSFMARKKQTVDDAFPGDVIGLYDRGNLKIGDTLTEGEDFYFKGMPSFSPENFKEVIATDPMRSKQIDTGLRHLVEEGVAQLFIQDKGRRKILGTVGELQFEVIKYRLEHEYNAACRFERLSYARACWLTAEDPKELERFKRVRDRQIAYDKDGIPVYFAESEWMVDQVRRTYPEVEFHFTSELRTDQSDYALRTARA
ncbi:MAG: peptide chain release factor 3, partial [Spirochaetes bacterium]|nr:peptide chain release factor 3 [Spirochaetota bacterium]